MKVTLDIPQNIINEIKKEIKEQGYKAPGDTELESALSIDIEANFELEVDDSEQLARKAEWVINLLDLKEEK